MRRQRLFLLLSVVIGLLLSVLLAEGLARLFFDEPVAPRFVVDPGYGVRANQADVETRHYVPGEFSVAVTTNATGLRGSRDYSPQKPANVERIIMLGDSFLFGHGVEDEEVVSAVLEERLNSTARSDVSYEVINFGVSGFGQAEELVTYRARVRQYDADVVVLFYFDNDIGNNKVSHLFALGDDGTVVRTANDYLPAVRLREILYGFPPVRWLFEHSEAWNVIRNRLSKLVQQSKLKKEGLETFSDSSGGAIELTKALLRQFVVDIMSDNARPIIVTIPQKIGLKTNFPFDSETVEALGAELLDGREFLLREDYWNQDGHWRPSGHTKTAAAIEQLLIE